jgi:hypothetical protein
MRKLLVLLVFLATYGASGPAHADPLGITSGAFVIDIEGDMFTLTGSGFSLQTTELLITSSKLFPPQCSQCAPGELVDWSFQTNGEQLLGKGNASIGAVNATNVDLVGTLLFDAVPTAFPAGGPLSAVFVAPFVFSGLIRGVQGGQELFAQQFTGQGAVTVDYESGAAPGLFTEDDDTIVYEFSAAPIPEPGTMLLIGSGLGVAVARRLKQRPRSRTVR